MQPTDINGKPYNRGLLVAVLIVGSFVTILNSTLLATAYPAIMKSFDVSTATVQWLSTGFIMVNGIMIPLSAFLINRFSSRIMYSGAILVFLIGTVTAYFAPNFGILLAGRLIQAIGVGVSMPMMQSVMLTIFPPEKRGVAMGGVGIAIGLAPAIGPTLSGYIVDHFTWRDLFGMIIPIAVVVFILSLILMKDVLPKTSPKLDIFSVITSILGVGTLLYGFAEVGDHGWTGSVVLLNLAIGAVLIALFAVRQFKLDEPFLDLKVFKTPQYSLATIISSLAFMGMMAAEMILPLYIQNILGKSAFNSGLILLPGALAMGIMSPITGRLFDRYGAKEMSIVGSIFLTFGSVAFLFLTDNTPILYITIFYAIRMFGIAMMMMTVTTAGMNELPTSLMSHGTAVNNTVRQVSSSIATAILTSVLTNVANNTKPSHHLLTTNPLEYKDHMISAVVAGYRAAFAVAVLFSVAAFLAAIFLKKGNQARMRRATLKENPASVQKEA